MVLIWQKQLSHPEVNHSRSGAPSARWGQVMGVIRRFGGAERLQGTLEEIQARLYAA